MALTRKKLEKNLSEFNFEAGVAEYVEDGISKFLVTIPLNEYAEFAAVYDWLMQLALDDKGKSGFEADIILTFRASDV